MATLEFNTALPLPTPLPVFPVLLVPTADTLEDAKSGQSMELGPENPLLPFTAPTVELLVPLTMLVVEIWGVVLVPTVLAASLGVSNADLALDWTASWRDMLWIRGEL